MKKLIVASLIAASSTIAHAWEHPLNPDRFPSIGASLSGSSTGGDASYPSAPFVGSQNVEHNTGMFVVDTRLPLSNSFTLGLAVGSISQKTTVDETPNLDSQKFDGRGGYFSISGRYYFNGGAK